MHHFLAGAHVVIGDSQTMIAEAGVLGTPAIRFNDFVGRLSYLAELENKYELTFGFKTNEQKEFFIKLDEILNRIELKKIWQYKVQRMINDKIDVTAFMVWFIQDYPKSAQTLKENPNYQYNFR